MLQSCGSSGTIALRNGIIAAIFTPAERGTYLGIIAGVTLCAPAFGPLIGGALTQTLGWRSIFWGLTIFTTAQTLIYVLFVPETNRRVVGNGSIEPEQWWNKTVWQLLHKSSSRQTASLSTTKTKVKLRWPNPIKVLAMLKEPDIALLIVTGSLCNAATYDIMASLPYMMTHTYGLSIIQLSLCYMYVGITIPTQGRPQLTPPGPSASARPSAQFSGAASSTTPGSAPPCATTCPTTANASPPPSCAPSPSKKLV